MWTTEVHPITFMLYFLKIYIILNKHRDIMEQKVKIVWVLRKKQQFSRKYGSVEGCVPVLPDVLVSSFLPNCGSSPYSGLQTGYCIWWKLFLKILI